MTEYIISEALYIEITDYDPDDEYAFSPEEMGADVLVRCKDCKHYDNQDYEPWCMEHCVVVEPDGFCSCGEKKEGAE